MFDASLLRAWRRGRNYCPCLLRASETIPLTLLVVRVNLDFTSVLASSFHLSVFDLKPFLDNCIEITGQMLSSFRSLLDFGGSAIYPFTKRRRSGSYLESSRASPIIGEICVP